MSILVETIGDAAIIIINRPEAKNAIDLKVAKRIGEAIRIATQDPSVRGIVLTASGSDTFVSGGDLKQFVELAQEPGGQDHVLGMIEGLAACETCDVPVIAAVQGNTYGGGCELLLLCDMVILERHATIAFRHAKMGLSPAWGGATRLVERVGPLEAARLLFTAEKIGADEALRIGLVNEVVDTGASRARAVARVNRIADNPRTSVAALKRSLREIRHARRGEALAREGAIFSEMWGKPDHQQAMSDFLSRKRS